MYVGIRIRIYSHNTHSVVEVRIHTREKHRHRRVWCRSPRSHLWARILLYMRICVWNSWCTRLHCSIAKRGTRGSSRRAVQAPCYDFQNREAQWPRSAPDKIVIIIVLAMAGIEERYTRELARVHACVSACMYVCARVYVYIWHICIYIYMHMGSMARFRSWARTLSIRGGLSI